LNYLTLENISKSYGDKVLFDNINLTISKGQKIALIARNGSGKTSLLRLIAGEESVDGSSARILIAKGIRIGYLKQEPHFDPQMTVLEAALDSENESIQAIKAYESATLKGDTNEIQKWASKLEDLKAWDIEVRIKEILGKLNIKDLTKKVSNLSGGQQKRVALAKMLIDEPDFYILDEPTNHLDIEMIEWLEKYLSSKNLTLFMITHDRYFLERVCNEMVELDGTELHAYRGNYSDYLEKKAARIVNQKTVLDKTKRLYKKELDWIRRQPKARGTKAKSRVDKFDAIKEAAHKEGDSMLAAIEIDSSRLGSKIIEVKDISKSFDDINIVQNFSYKFKKRERVGIAGSNGVGKSTLIQLLTQEIKPDTGKVVLGETVVFGHYTQSNLDIRDDKRVIDVIRDIADYIPLKKGLKLSAEALLERFLFPREQQQVYVSKLSGGEKRRLHLITVLIKNPNFLILDEPTNDLDILTLNVMEDYLMTFPGCLLIVSHDRYFMDKLVDHIFVMKGDGQIKDFNGTYSEYKQSVKTAQKEKGNESSKAEKPKVTAEAEASEVRKLSYFEKKEFNEIEGLVKKLEKEKTKLETQFSDTTLSPEKITEMSIRLGEIKNEIDDKENRWLELSEFA